MNLQKVVNAIEDIQRMISALDIPVNEVEIEFVKMADRTDAIEFTAVGMTLVKRI